jgi:hypothetical protein
LRAVSHKGFNQNTHDTIERFVSNEEQLLMGYANYDANTYVHFVYDHKGERILKGSLTTANLAHNGQDGPLSLSMDAYTHYVNPYFVAAHYNTTSKTSKHYYMGAERVATNLGTYTPLISGPGGPIPDFKKEGGTHPLINNLTDILTTFRLEETHEFTAEALLTRADFATYHGTADSAQAHKTEGSNNTAPAMRLMYWYHPDYLGHVEYITDLDGAPHQYFYYIAPMSRLPTNKPLVQRCFSADWSRPLARWGDTVNTASRMESSDEKKRIQNTCNFKSELKKFDGTCSFNLMADLTSKERGF